MLCESRHRMGMRIVKSIRRAHGFNTIITPTNNLEFGLIALRVKEPLK
jgi:hypothetical protein